MQLIKILNNIGIARILNVKGKNNINNPEKINIMIIDLVSILTFLKKEVAKYIPSTSVNPKAIKPIL